MQDVTALMGKLQGNVSYLQFSDASSEDRSGWPPLDRLADAERTAAPASEGSARPPSSRFAAVEVAPAQSRKLSDIFSRLQR